MVNHLVIETESHTEHSVQIDQVFSALAHATRRAILKNLTQGPITVSDLAAQFSVSMPAISKHLRVLERAGLLRQQKEGRIRYCHLVPKPLEDAAEWLEFYRMFWEERFDALEEFLDESDESDSQKPKLSPSNLPD
ncbi:metalloregulator ArsR/SmtB family transcription factor [Chloroflexi bacterium TSY]|nr:metalloregulator ArsR/SmtB family transcription factor [Chloroflexi bacterium TSY]